MDVVGYANRITSKQDIGRIISMLSIVAVFTLIVTNPKETHPVWLTPTVMFTNIVLFISLLLFSIIPLRIPTSEIDVTSIPLFKHIFSAIAGAIVSCSTCMAYFLFIISCEVMTLSVSMSPTAHRKFRASVAAYSRLLLIDVIFRMCYRRFTNPAIILIYINNLSLVYIFLIIAFPIVYSQTEQPLKWREQFKLFLNLIYELKFRIRLISSNTSG